MTPGFRGVSVVVIGLNVEKHLKDCLSSVRGSDFPDGLMEIIYVDGGSHDGSVGIARSFEGVRVVELRHAHPTPGRGRNAGIAIASYGVIQFLDGDTVLHPAWIRTALPLLQGNVAVVTGRLRERYPGRNAFHTIADCEWCVSAGAEYGGPFAGDAQAFGGIVLASKDAVLEAGGYDGSLVAGEDPDLSYRMRLQGWTLRRCDADMAFHDIDMASFAQYMRRSARSGHAYAQIGLRYARCREKFYLGRLVRTVLGALAPPALVGAGLASGRPLMGIIAAAGVALRPFRKIRSFMRPGAGCRTALLYCSHLSFAVYPQFLGVLSYLTGCITGMPLRNRGRRQDELHGHEQARPQGNDDHAEKVWRGSWYR